MINARAMYLRPGNLFKDFTVEDNEQEINSRGRAVIKYSGNGLKTFRGCLANASDQDKANHSISDHIVTHTIVQIGPPKAKRTDKLIMGDRVFYVIDVDDTGTLGVATLYYAEERTDVK